LPKHSGALLSLPGSTEYYRPRLVDLRADDRSGFDCGETTLDEWLRRYAGQSRRGNTAARWVIVDRDRKVAAYAALSMTAIDLSAAPLVLAKGASNPIPALLVGRLAVDRLHAGRGARHGHGRSRAGDRARGR
jgi:hypothetical protein